MFGVDRFKKTTVLHAFGAGLLSGLVVFIVNLSFCVWECNSIREQIAMVSVMGGAGFLYGLTTAPFFFHIKGASSFWGNYSNVSKWVFVSGLSYFVAYWAFWLFSAIGAEDMTGVLLMLSGITGALLLVLGYSHTVTRLTKSALVFGTLLGGIIPLLCSLLFPDNILTIINIPWQTGMTIYLTVAQRSQSQ